MAEESILRPFYTVFVLALVCSALVAGAAVGLRPYQEANRQLDRKKHILAAAGLYTEGKSVDELFKGVEPMVVDLASGNFVTDGSIDPDKYNQRKAALSADLSSPLAAKDDTAKIRRLEKYAVVYLVKDPGGKIQEVVLPVRGKGLWSTMYAYVALDRDMTTIRGISFYEHGETPGLGGEVENENWQDSWRGKKVYDQNGKQQLHVVKGKAASEAPQADFQIDGLSGATLTTKGVDNLMKFWFGDHGYEPFIAKMKTHNKDVNNG
jgi:Na+-transporting NADH:ubiquinone oxidoreductase subunit C